MTNPWPAAVPQAVGDLRILRLCFELQCQAEARLPHYLGSTLRGGLVMAAKRMLCTHNMRPCDGCPVQRACLYPYLFETPHATGSQPFKRSRDFPHPIVIEPPLCHPQHYRSGERFSFQIVLIGEAQRAVPYLIFAVMEMAAQGLGGQRRPFRLWRVTGGDGQPLYDAQDGVLQKTPHTYSVRDLWQNRPPPERVALRLQTPLRAKVDGGYLHQLNNAEILRKLMFRRLRSLVVGYESCQDKESFNTLFAIEPPALQNSQVRWKNFMRYSNRQKSKLNMGGLVGRLELNGNLQNWWPLLLASAEVHLGKGSIMGLGKIDLQITGE